MQLRNKDKQTLLSIFSSVDIPIEVWAYGSRVNGTVHEGSDLDLAIKSGDGHPLPVNVYTNLVEKIRDSNIPILVELFDWARLPESFHHNIEQNHEVLYSSLQLVVKEPKGDYQSKRKRK